jgi:hypothetical protein
MYRAFAVFLSVLLLAAYSRAANVADLVRTIKAVGPEAAGSAAAASAWKELTRLPAAELPQLLAALDDASPTAANWLRSAVDAVAERERRAGRSLPAIALEVFVRDTKHAGRARYLAYELLSTADSTAPARLLPAMLDDPGAELRYDAVAAAFDATQKQPAESAAAKDRLRNLLSAARDGGQVDAIARELDRRGEHVDLVAHYGFINRWQVAGPFDNTGGRGFRTPFPPESGVDLAAKYAGKAGAVIGWREVTADKIGTVNLNAVFPDPAGAKTHQGMPKGLKAVAGFAFAEVDSPSERPAQVRAASATAIKVFVNGREVLVHETYHQSFDRDAFVGPTRIVKGRNTILVKVCQNDQPEEWAQNWMFQLRLTDDLGAAVPVTVTTPGPWAGGQR